MTRLTPMPTKEKSFPCEGNYHYHCTVNFCGCNCHRPSEAHNVNWETDEQKEITKLKLEAEAMRKVIQAAKEVDIRFGPHTNQSEQDLREALKAYADAKYFLEKNR